MIGPASSGIWYRTICFSCLTMVAMEPPSAMDADSLRNNKVEALRAIRRWGPAQAAEHSVLGQYRGYLDEAGVAPGSKTPTYAALCLYIDNWRWQGVPFYLRTGKALRQKVTEIAIQFRQPPHLMFWRRHWRRPQLQSALLEVAARRRGSS